MRLILLLLLLAGCGPAWHLQRSKHHISKAIEKGATIKSDTTYKKFKFNIEGASTNIDLGPIVYQRQDGVKFVPVLKDTIIYKDRIKTQIKNNTVYVECPDEQEEVEVPVTVDTNISAGYTKWQYAMGIIGGVVMGAIIGFVLGKVLKVGIF